jgi:hypothetical protein
MHFIFSLRKAGARFTNCFPTLNLQPKMAPPTKILLDKDRSENYTNVQILKRLHACRASRIAVSPPEELQSFREHRPLVKDEKPIGKMSHATSEIE